MKISTKIVKLKQKIGKINQEIADIQEQCPHDNLKLKRGGNTGNYDPSADCYWTDYHCPDCQKKWTVFH